MKPTKWWFFFALFFIANLYLVFQGQGCARKKFVSTSQELGDSGISIPDPYFDLQWYLGGKSIASSFDISVKPVWDSGNMGQGVSIVVIDPSSIYLQHTDLDSNKDLSKTKNFIYLPAGTNTTMQDLESHGTCVAGVIGAREMNGKGVRGISSRSLISGRNTTGVESDIFDALTYKYRETDIASNSYGPPDYLAELNDYYDNDLFNQGIQAGISQGRGGLGTIYVWAGGNGRQYEDRSNYDGYASHYGVMSICSVGTTGAVSNFSEPGSNLWVCAPGEKIATTDYEGMNCSDGNNGSGGLNSEDYTKNFMGTSASTPVVSGVAGLILREAKLKGKSLGWRDVKMIIAESASKPTNVSWQPTRIRFNDNLGFGIINAQKAVSLVGTWNSVGNTPWTSKPLGSGFLGPQGTSSLGDGGTDLPMKSFRVDNSMSENGVNIFNSNITYIEYVMLEVKLSHSDPGDLDISLVKSPLSGGASAISKITTSHTCWDEAGGPIACTSAVSTTYQFGVSNFLGESAQGEWFLKIKDARANGRVGSVVGWRLKLYGH